MTPDEIRTEIGQVKDGIRSVILLSNLTDEAKAELILTSEECVDEAAHDELAAAEADEQERQAGIWHDERLADLRDYERRVF